MPQHEEARSYGEACTEFALTDIAEYVSLVSRSLLEQGVPPQEVQALVDGYGDVILDDWLPEGASIKNVASSLVQLRSEGRTPRQPNVSLYGLSTYVGGILVHLMEFGYSFDDAADMIDDNDELVTSWYPAVSDRSVARRLSAIDRKMHAEGRSLNE